MQVKLNGHEITKAIAEYIARKNIFPPICQLSITLNVDKDGIFGKTKITADVSEHKP